MVRCYPTILDLTKYKNKDMHTTVFYLENLHPNSIENHLGTMGKLPVHIPLVNKVGPSLHSIAGLRTSYRDKCVVGAPSCGGKELVLDPPLGATSGTSLTPNLRAMENKHRTINSVVMISYLY